MWIVLVNLTPSGYVATSAHHLRDTDKERARNRAARGVLRTDYTVPTFCGAELLARDAAGMAPADPHDACAACVTEKTRRDGGHHDGGP